MLFNFFVFLLIVLITLFFSTQGLLTSLLGLATSIFSSVLAMALTEPLEHFIGSWRLDMARGLTFLVLFVAIFGITRFAADLAVPGNIKLPKMINRTSGGFIGFFTALTVVGTLVIGLEMLPVPRVILYYDRFPNKEHGIASDNPGEPAKMSGVWFGPDRFVLTLWSAMSGRSMGGSRVGGWSSVHPDISIESYGYRNNVRSASARSVPPQIFSVDEVWSVPGSDPKEIAPAQALGIPAEAGKRIVMVRTDVKKGDATAGSSDNNNTDAYFRISATQVRLVTTKGHQYYPIGYLEFGRHFVALPLDSGHIVEDYTSGMVLEDWVFRIQEDEEAQLVELKQFGRKELAKDEIRPHVTPPKAAAAYPQHGYFKDLSSVTVTFTAGGHKLIAGHVFLLKPSIPLQDIKSEVNSAFDKATATLNNIRNSSGGWSSERKPGVPDSGAFSAATNQGPNIMAGDDKAGVSWGNLFMELLPGQATPAGDQNLSIYPRYFDETLLPIWKKAGGGEGVILNSAETTEPTTVTIPRVIKGNQEIVITLLTDHGFFMWSTEHTFDAGQNLAITAGGDGKITGIETTPFAINLDQK